MGTHAEPEEPAIPRVMRVKQAIIAPVKSPQQRMVATLAVVAAIVTLAPEPWAAAGAAAVVLAARR